MKNKHQKDIDLVNKLKQNDRHAWLEFYKETSNTIDMLFFKKMIRLNIDQSDEYKQQILIKLSHVVLCNFDPDRASLRTWVYTIAHNYLADSLRRKKSHAKFMVDSYVLHGEDIINSVDVSPDMTPDIVERQVTWEKLMLYSYLNSLDRDNWGAIYYKFFMGKKLLQYSKDFDIKYPTVKTNLFRTKKAMIKFMAERKLKDLECFDYDVARNVIMELGFTHEGDWQLMLETNDPPPGIPRHPDFYYFKKGWTTWENFLSGN